MLRSVPPALPALLFVLALGLCSGRGWAQGSERLSLDGTWAFTVEAAQLDRPLEAWDRLPVPGNWDTTNRYAQHVGPGWYRRLFTLPDGWQGRRVRLCFEAVYETAEVFLNGRSLGRHQGGYTPFEFDITHLARRDQENELTVRADNTYRRGAWWAWGGISRSVSLVALPDVRLVRQHVRGELNLSDGTAVVHVDCLVDQAGPDPLPVEVRGEIRYQGQTVGHWSAAGTIPGGGSLRLQGRVSLPARDVHPWHIESPSLYTSHSRVQVGDRITDTRQDRFGLRHIAVKPDGLYLNGERVRLVGFNRVHDHRAYGNTEPEHLIRLDVDLMKRYGAHFMRIMHAPTAPNLLDYLDEKGVMIFAEIPVWGGDDPQVKADNPTTRAWMKEMIERDYNHPCIIGWSPGNELLGHNDYVKSMIDYARKELDPHRLHAYVSFSGGRRDYGPANDPITVSDLILYNSYGSDPGALVANLAEKWPGKPVFLSEFGARQFGEELGARIPGLDERWHTLAGRPQVIGTALWTFNDYRSNYRNSEPGELRSWGMVDLWRQPKEAARDIARLHSPIARLRVEGGRALLLPRRAEEFPSFTLRGYHLVWEWRPRSGPALAGGVVRLPDLPPGSPEFSIALTGRPSAEDGLVVSLVSPTGYSVHDYTNRESVSLAPATRPTARSAPTIVRAYPLDGGFMLGYSTQPDDTTFTVEYGLVPGAPDQTLTVAQKGAFSVTGLENGRTYHGRLRRQTVLGTPSDWSVPFAVTPDGQRAPAAPTWLAAVRGAGLISLRFAPVEKATAYRIRWGAAESDSRRVEAAAPGPVVLTGLGDHQRVTFTVTALRGALESTPSAAVTVEPTLASAPQPIKP